MATSTSYDLYPLEKFSGFDAYIMATLDLDAYLGRELKYGLNDKGQTVFQYIDPDKQRTEYKYPVLSVDKYGWKTYDYKNPIVNPSTGTYDWPIYYADGTPLTNKTYLERSAYLKISDDGRTLQAIPPGNTRTVQGWGSDTKWTLNGTGANETLTSSGSNQWASGSSTTPVFGVGAIPTEGLSSTEIRDAYSKYTGAFAKLAQGVNQRIKSYTVTDSGILGDIKDTIGKLGPLAPLALSFALPGLGSAIGAALGATGATAAVIGNTLINTVMNGGDVGQALTGSLIGATGLEAGSLASDIAKGGELGSFLQSNPQYLSSIANSVTQTALKGGDIEAALTNSLFSTSISAATSQIPGYNDLDPKLKTSVDAAVTGALQGKDVTGSVINAAIKAGQAAINSAGSAPQDDGTTSGIQDVINDIETKPQDDGTTTDIQDIIDAINGGTKPPDTTPPTDTTTGGSLGDASDLPPEYTGGSLGDESDMPPPDQGGSLGDESDLPPDTTGGSLGDESDLPPPTEEEPQCAEGFTWNGSMCVANTDPDNTETTCPDGYLFDLDTQTCVPIGSTGGGTTTGGTTPKPPTTPTTPTTPKQPTTPTTPTTPTGTGGLDFAALLALLGGGQQAQPQQPAVADVDMVDIEDLLDNPLQTDYRKLARKT